ncbi:hypothetical protein OROMI_016375 [Orobanche minor]
MDEDGDLPLILERPFLATGKALIDVERGELTLRVNDEHVLFSIFKAMKFQDDVEECQFLSSIDSCINEHFMHLLSSDPLECGIVNSYYSSHDLCDLDDLELIDNIFVLDALEEASKKEKLRKLEHYTDLPIDTTRHTVVSEEAHDQLKEQVFSVKSCLPVDTTKHTVVSLTVSDDTIVLLLESADSDRAGSAVPQISDPVKPILDLKPLPDHLKYIFLSANETNPSWGFVRFGTYCSLLWTREAYRWLLISVYGTFVLACYDTNKEEFQSISKIGRLPLLRCKGFSDALLDERSAGLGSKVIPKPKSYLRFSERLNPDVWFEPTENEEPCVSKLEKTDLDPHLIYEASLERGFISRDYFTTDLLCRQWLADGLKNLLEICGWLFFISYYI